MENSKRYYIILAALGILLLGYTIRLFHLQVLDKSYRRKANENAIREKTIHPARGFIYDRNDSLLVYNDAAYDLMVVPNELRNFDTLELCRVLDLNIEEVRKKIEKATKYSKTVPSLFKQQISKEDYGYLQEKMSEFPGFFVQSRTLRSYPQPIAAHILGYVSEVDEQDVENDPYYKMGDYIGKSGIEKAYEPVLRGVKGKQKVLVDVHNREVGPYNNGEEDIVAVPGISIWSTLDMQLQRYGEELMSGKRGAIVAIEPKTGEILCLVSSPNYDPNLLVGTARPKNYGKLVMDPEKPLFNRALQAAYPPGHRQSRRALPQLRRTEHLQRQPALLQHLLLPRLLQHPLQPHQIQEHRRSLHRLARPHELHGLPAGVRHRFALRAERPHPDG